MPVPVMDVRIVRVRMNQRFVLVRTGVRGWIGHRRVVRPVHVLMMLVVHVRVLVRHRLVAVLVLVTFGEMEPEADAHQRGRHDEGDTRPLPEDQERRDGADEGRRGELRARARRAEAAQREDEQHEAHPVAEEPQQQSPAHMRQRRPMGA